MLWHEAILNSKSKTAYRFQVIRGRMYHYDRDYFGNGWKYVFDKEGKKFYLSMEDEAKEIEGHTDWGPIEWNNRKELEV